MKALGIEFAPLNVPLERRLQTLAVLLALFEFLTGVYAYFILAFLFSTEYYYISVCYLAWVYYDRNTCRRGGRLVPWFRKLTLYKYYGKYFPITLEKTAELDPSKNYIFGYHPHGILATGAFGNFATDGTGFSSLFPGIMPRLVTLHVNFWFPLHRELSLFRGHISADKDSIQYVLTKNGTGNAIVIVVGGAAEAIDAVPDTMKLTIKSRKGFVRLAMQHGASLVPVISFGENEVFFQSPIGDKSKMRKIQNQVKRMFRFTLPLFHGRGIFQYSMGLLPFRTPIHTIVGKPIDIPKIENPSREEVDAVHDTYMKSLTTLFNENKTKYARDDRLELELQ